MPWLPITRPKVTSTSPLAKEKHNTLLPHLGVNYESCINTQQEAVPAAKFQDLLKNVLGDVLKINRQIKHHPELNCTIVPANWLHQ